MHSSQLFPGSTAKKSADQSLSVPHLIEIHCKMPLGRLFFVPQFRCDPLNIYSTLEFWQMVLEDCCHEVYM